jgi:hypothetical protein
MPRKIVFAYHRAVAAVLAALATSGLLQMLYTTVRAEPTAIRSANLRHSRNTPAVEGLIETPAAPRIGPRKEEHT